MGCAATPAVPEQQGSQLARAASCCLTLVSSCRWLLRGHMRTVYLSEGVVVVLLTAAFAAVQGSRVEVRMGEFVALLCRA